MIGKQNAGCIVALACTMLACSTAKAQGVTRIDTVPAPSLAANLLGDPAWRQVSVYLPPSYAKEPRRRYPVVYWLHGFTSDDRELISGICQNLNIRLAMDSLLREGAAREMIIVMPNAHNAFGGSFFANSPVTGRWEDFIVRDLVRWGSIDVTAPYGRDREGGSPDIRWAGSARCESHCKTPPHTRRSMR